MPIEVQYSYPEIKDDVLILQDGEAKDLDEAERVALNKLSDMLPDEVEEVNIESVRFV